MTATSSVIIMLLLLCFVIYSLMYPNIYQGIRVDGVDLSGCSSAQASQLLTAWQQERHNKKIILDFDQQQFKLAATNIDFDVDSSEALDAAWHYGRDGSWWERMKKIRAAQKKPYDISLGIKYDEVKLNHLIEQWQRAIERPARNATISMTTGKVIPDQQGYKLEVDTLRSLILQSLMKSEDVTVVLPVTTVYPEVTVDDLASMGIHEAISAYTTVFNSQDDNRVANIKLAATKVNGYIIYPGKTFSFNDVVGPREKSYGFKEAMEIADGEFVPGIGGGICQLSSTLYNAVILANLDITERYNHSKTLPYVPAGRDATVAFGLLDFKFVNNTPEPLMIAAEVKGNELMVGVFGQHSIAEKVEIISMNQEQILPTIIKQQDDSLYLGETKLEKQGTPGIALTVMRVVRLKGQMIKQEVLSQDRYLGEDTILKIGTKIPPFAETIQ